MRFGGHARNMIRSAVFFCLCLSLRKGVFGDEVTSVSVTEGDSVTLNSDVTEIQTDDQILWMFGPQNTRIAEIHRQKISYYDITEKFRDRLQMDTQTGSLTIRNINMEHAGLYKLEIIRSSGSNMKNFNINIYARLPVPVITRNSSQCESCNISIETELGPTLVPESNQTSLLLAVTLPLLLLLLLLLLFLATGLVVLIFCRRRKYTQAKQDAQTNEEEVDYTDVTFIKHRAPDTEADGRDQTVYSEVVLR